MPNKLATRSKSIISLSHWDNVPHPAARTNKKLSPSMLTGDGPTESMDTKIATQETNGIDSSALMTRPALRTAPLTEQTRQHGPVAMVFMEVEMTCNLVSSLMVNRLMSDQEHS